MLAEDFEIDIDFEPSNNKKPFAEINKKLLRKDFRKKNKIINKKPLPESDASIKVQKTVTNIASDISQIFCDSPLEFVIEKREAKTTSTIFPMSVRRKIDEEWLINSEKAIHAINVNDDLVKKQLPSDNLQDETENMGKVVTHTTTTKKKSKRVKRLKRTNFILLNLKKKTFSRDQKRMTFNKYKFNLWKLKKSQARAQNNNN